MNVPAQKGGEVEADERRNLCRREACPGEGLFIHGTEGDEVVGAGEVGHAVVCDGGVSYCECYAVEDGRDGGGDC